MLTLSVSPSLNDGLEASASYRHATTTATTITACSPYKPLTVMYMCGAPDTLSFVFYPFLLNHNKQYN
eukprot:m.38384 g.38384  ORF g.38384 m.38384 type:complete len:68 (+) comp10193_c0_seq1:1217-1420(+)